MALRKVKRKPKVSSNKTSQVGSQKEFSFQKKNSANENSETIQQENQLKEDDVMKKNTLAAEQQISFFNGSASLLRTALVPEGEYCFRIDDVEVKKNIKGKFDKTYDQDFFTFSLKRTEHDTAVQVTIPFTISYSDESPFIQFLSNFASIFGNQKIVVSQLIGFCGICDINHYTTSTGSVYERIQVKEVFNELDE